MPRTRIVVIDDQPLIRQGIRAALADRADIDLVGEAGDLAEAAGSIAATRPHVVLLDLHMPGGDPVRMAHDIRRGRFGVAPHVIAFAGGDNDVVCDAIRAGATSVLLKDCGGDSLVEAIRTVMDGNAVLAPSVARLVVTEYARRPRPVAQPGDRRLDRLTDREREVFSLLVRGHDVGAIAAKLHLARTTVKSHVHHLYHKLGISNRVQLVIYAYERGLLEGLPRHHDADRPEDRRAPALAVDPDREPRLLTG